MCSQYEAGTVEQEEYVTHVNQKDRARLEKSDDKQRSLENDTIKVLTMDLQSVLICPALMASSSYFRTKLTCHNFTTYNLSNRDVMCYLWHEGEVGLSANTFASCIVDQIGDMIQDKTEEIILYSDGCGYQNRNCTLSNALLHVSVKNNLVVTQKFLIKGHTQMEVDSVHTM